MSARQAWRAIQAALPEEAIISSDIGNNCAIGDAYPTFEQGRKYLAPGLFGPCGYGFPSIVGAKIGCPDVPVVGFAGDGAFGIAMNELVLDRPRRVAGDHDGGLPQLPVGRREAEHDALVRRQFRRHGTQPAPELRKVAEACGLKGVVGPLARRADRGPSRSLRGAGATA